jgi:hypothetical protein
MDIYDRIKQETQKHRIKMSDLEKAISAYRGKFTDLKNGKTTLKDDEIAIIAAQLGVDAYKLKFGVEMDIKKPAIDQDDGTIEKAMLFYNKMKEQGLDVTTMTPDEIGRLAAAAKGFFKK